MVIGFAMTNEVMGGIPANFGWFDIESQLYFVNDPSLRITVEARSLKNLAEEIERRTRAEIVKYLRRRRA